MKRALLAVAMLAVLAGLTAPAAAQANATAPDVPENATIKQTLDQRTAVLSANVIQNGGAVRLRIYSSKRQPIVVVDEGDYRETEAGRVQSYRRTRIDAGTSTIVVAPSESFDGGDRRVTVTLRSGLYKVEVESGGGDLWPDANRDVVSAFVALLSVLVLTFGIAYRKRKNPDKHESAHDSGSLPW